MSQYYENFISIYYKWITINKGIIFHKKYKFKKKVSTFLIIFIKTNVNLGSF